MQHIKIPHFASKQATSLINLLIFSVISSLIILLMFNLYIFITKQTKIIEQKIDFFHKQDLANFFLRTYMQNAGYKGPASGMFIPQYSSINNNLQQHTQIIPKAPIATCVAAYNNCKEFIPTKILDKINKKIIKPNTSIILAYDIPSKIHKLTLDMQDPSAPLIVNNLDNNIHIGDQLIIADYYNIQRFVVSNIYKNYLYHEPLYNHASCFVKNFTKNAEIFKVKNLAFYIAKNNTYSGSNWSLYVEDFSTTTRAEALLDDVQDLKIKIINPNNNTIELITDNWVFEKYILVSVDNIKHIGIAIENGYL